MEEAVAANRMAIRGSFRSPLLATARGVSKGSYGAGLVFRGNWEVEFSREVGGVIDCSKVQAG